MNTSTQKSDLWDTTTLDTERETFNVLAELKGKKWLCRGQSRCYGELVPSIDRDSRKELSRNQKITLERQSIDLFRSTAVYFSHPGEQGAQTSDIIALMVLRHYGVHTRLLDWTLSPYVATYFATYHHDKEDGELWSFSHDAYAKQGRKQWSEFPETTSDRSGDPDKFDYSLPTAFQVAEPPDWFVCQFYKGFPRQTAQIGAYSLTARFNRDHSELIAKLLKDRGLYHKYIIRAHIKRQLVTTLKEKYGIWRGPLFPDVAGAAETASSIFNKASN